MFKTIVVSATDTPVGRETVLSALTLANSMGADLHIVATIQNEQGPNRTEHGGYVHDDHPAAPLLVSLRELAQEQGIEPNMHASTESPAHAVVTIAENVDADLIVVGNKGKTSGRRMLGSVASHVTHAAHCSVIVIDTRGAV
ncbi:MAG: universal stress protein [Acidimicrobiales bacterium]|jgi:hypothetical protein